MTPASYSRRMQFEAGPESSVFYACTGHAPRLDGYTNCHFPVTQWPVQPEDTEDELTCDFCREEAL
jgi:hypothetical protein